MNEAFQVAHDDAVALIREYAPPPVQNQLIASLRPAIAVEASNAPEDLPIGASKFFGEPDVPAGFEWPHVNDHPLQFVAQFNLAEVAPFDREKILPTSGLLSFFYDYDLTCRVYHWPTVDTRLSRPEKPQSWLTRLNHFFADKAETYPFCSLKFDFSWVFPHEESPERLDFTVDDYEEMEQLFAEFPCAGHQLLGHATPVQGSVEYEAALQAGNLHYRKDAERIEEDAKSWRLLFQMDSQMPDKHARGWLWGDVGMLYFMIRREDLQQHNFEAVQLVFQCH